MIAPRRGTTAPAGVAAVGERLGHLDPLARWFLLGVMIVGLLVVLTAIREAETARPALFITMVALALLTATVKLPLPWPLTRSDATLSVSSALTFAALYLLGTACAVVVGVVSAWGQCTFPIRSRTPWHRTMFSMAAASVSAFAAAQAFDGMMGVGPWSAGAAAPASSSIAAQPAALLNAVMASALAHGIAYSALVSTARALTTRQAIRRVWIEDSLSTAPGGFMAAIAGYGVVFVDSTSQAWGAWLAVPLYLTYRSYRSFIVRLEDERAQVRRLADIQLATIESLALAIEVKDQTSQSHIQRFQVYAEGLALAADLGEDDVRAVKTAALLHDIGNLAVPEHILTKPGALTPEEFRRLQEHPKVGAGIVASVPFQYPVAPLIAAHHEHWDGSGYPLGLAGQQIPTGARILSIVDFFTALLSDRPYRSAKSFGEAMTLLRAEAGKTLDPNLVQIFLEILPELEQRWRGVYAATLARRQAAGRGHVASDAALERIAGTHREARALYDLAQLLGSSLGLDETFGLLAEKLRTLIPYSACALFLRDGVDDTLVCQRAEGIGEAALLRMRQATLAQLCDDESSAPTEGRAWPPEFGASLVAPLRQGDRIIGALAVCRVGPSAYGPEDRRLLDLIAQHAAPVVHNSLVFERAQEASLTDPLTGLANRRALHQALAADLGGQRSAARLAVLLLDLDNLKLLNDSFGHHVGDRAIREVGHVLQSMLRPGDICARYAGDEFVVVLRNCDAQGARSRALDLQAAVGRIHIEIAPDNAAGVSVSVGVATCPEDGHTQEDLIAAADGRMYRDKTRTKASHDDEAGRDAA